MVAETVSSTRAAQVAFRWRFRLGVRSMLRAFPPNCFFANIAGTLVFTESNAMSPCSPLASSTTLFSQGAVESQLDFGRDFDGKSAENRSKIGRGAAFSVQSAGESLWWPFWPRISPLRATFGRSGVALGDPGASLGRLGGAQGEPRGGLGPPGTVSGGSPGTLRAAPGQPWTPPGRPGGFWPARTTDLAQNRTGVSTGRSISKKTALASRRGAH